MMIPLINCAPTKSFVCLITTLILFSLISCAPTSESKKTLWLRSWKFSETKKIGPILSFDKSEGGKISSINSISTSRSKRSNDNSRDSNSSDNKDETDSKPKVQFNIPPKNESTESSVESEKKEPEKESPNGDIPTTPNIPYGFINTLPPTVQPDSSRSSSVNEPRSLNEAEPEENTDQSVNENSSNISGQRNKLLEILLNELPNFQFHITPKVIRHNDTTHLVELHATVVRLSNDTPPFNLPIINASEKDLIRLADNIFSPNEREDRNRTYSASREISSDQAPTTNIAENVTTQSPLNDHPSTIVPDVYTIKPNLNSTEISLLTNEPKSIPIDNNETKTVEMLKNQTETKSNEETICSRLAKANANVASSRTGQDVESNSSENLKSNVSVVGVIETRHDGTRNSSKIDVPKVVPTDTNENPTNQTTKNTLESNAIIDPTPIINTTFTESPNQVRSPSIVANQTTNPTNASPIIPNGPIKKAPETQWKPDGIKFGPNYYTESPAKVNRMYNYDENVINEKMTRKNQMKFPGNKPISPMVPVNQRSFSQDNQRPVSKPRPQQGPAPIAILLQNTTPTPTGQMNNYHNNPNANTVLTRESYQYPIRQPHRDPTYNHYNVENQVDQYKQTYSQPRSYSPGRPIVVEEIVRSERNPLQMQPELFVKIIRHYFANALTPEESRYTFERNVPIVRQQSRP